MSAVSGEVPRSRRLPVLAKYDVVEELGHGGMATVYRAHDRRLGRDVAVKVIHPHLRDSGEVARRFSIEAQAVAKLRHPNIVEVYDVSAEGEPEQYLVVELLRGRTLRKMLQAQGALPPEVAASIGVELLSALAHAHAQGVVHRDIKPENVIIEHRAAPAPEAQAPSGKEVSSQRQLPTEPGDRISVKLTDFGIAKLIDHQGMTSTGQVLGSPAHMAPEQIEGQDVDARADVFSMGVLLYECMVGHLPFEGNNPAQVLRRVLDGIYPSAERERPTVGKVWSLILDKALGRTPSARYESAGAMREALLSELRRINVPSPRCEIEAYCDDPQGSTARREKELISILCERALAARKRGDAVSAAADYNRALAYAPHDAALLRIVSSLHGAEARRRLLRRIAPLGLGTIFLGLAAFGVTRELAKRKPVVDPVVVPVSAVVSVDPPATSASTPPGTSASAAASAGAPSTKPVRTGPPGTGGAAPGAGASTTPQTGGAGASTGPVAPKGMRVIRFLDALAGEQVAIDGAPPRDLPPDGNLPLDTKAHDLVLTCPLGCQPKPQQVPAGNAAMEIHAELSFTPAKIRLSGRPGFSYSADGIPLRNGDNDMAMKTGSRLVKVTELESGASQDVRLVANKTMTVTFGP